MINIKRTLVKYLLMQIRIEDIITYYIRLIKDFRETHIYKESNHEWQDNDIKTTITSIIPEEHIKNDFDVILI